MSTDVAHRKIVLQNCQPWISSSGVDNGTMDVPNHIDGDVVLYLNVHKAFLLYKVIVCSEYDRPCVPSRERLPIFKPLNYRSNELYRDPVFSVVRRLKFRAIVGFLHLAGTFIPGSEVEPGTTSTAVHSAPSAMISKHLSAALFSSSTSIAFSNSILRTSFCVDSSSLRTCAFCGSRATTFFRSATASCGLRICRWHIARLRFAKESQVQLRTIRPRTSGWTVRTGSVLSHI